MIGSLPKGTSKSFPFQVFQADLVTPSTAFLASDVLSSVVTPGEDLPSVATPQATWTDATVATWALNFVGSDTLGDPIVPGIYRVLVNATRGPETVELLRDTIEILVVPGTGVAPKTYGTFEDLADECNWIAQFQDSDQDQLGFAEQRAKARVWMDTLILQSAPTGGGFISRQWGWNWSNSGATWNSGARIGIDTVLEGFLATDCLMLGGARGGRIITACSCYAIALVLRAQPGGDQAKLSGWYMRRAQAEASLVVAEVDTNGDGRAEYVIPLSASNTRYG